MPSVVYYGSAKQRRLSAAETLPAKLDRVLERLHLKDRVHRETVAIKMHLGSNIGYSTVHPVFVRKVVAAVKAGGGRPFVTDTAHSALSAAERGYSAETLGCPILPAGGPDEKHYYPHTRPFKGITEWQVNGALQEASFLIDLAHAKGHPTCGFGGLFKNLALGGNTAHTRSQMHDTMQYDPYWFPERCPDPEVRAQVMASCPHGALIQDKQDPARLHLHFDQCNQCGRCLKIAPEGALKIDAVNFHAFQQACAFSVANVLSTFPRDKQVYVTIATHMTPVCDCFGFTGLPILPDAGVLGSDDIVAGEQAALDVIARTPLLMENVPDSMEVQPQAGPHPFQQLHGPYKDPYLVVRLGEELGLGTRQYELVDVMQEAVTAEQTYISAPRL